MLIATDSNFKKLKIRIGKDMTPEIGEGLALSDIPKTAKATIETLIRMGAVKLVDVQDSVTPVQTSELTETFQSPATQVIVSNADKQSNKKSNQGGGK
jgi:hypothetical protein